jgi:uncharacterized membrane protein HdeD (DUF308 family)
MKIFTMMFGILLAVCGFSCIFTPIMTFLETGWFLMILLFVYGIMGIIKAVTQKEYKIQFLFSIISVILGAVILFVPGLRLMTDGMLIYLMAGWFLLQGIVDIFLSFRQKKRGEGKGWIWTMILGILGLLVGIYSFVHPLFAAFTIGILVGIYFIESGINMVVIAQYIQEET